MSTEGMESLLQGVEGVFTWDKEENHNQESQALAAPWRYLSFSPLDISSGDEPPCAL